MVVPAITEDGRSNWPDRWPIERLLAKKQEIGSIAFSSQFQLDPIDPETAALKREWLHFYLDKDLPPLAHYIGVDPSPSGAQQTDYFALAVLGVDEEHNGYLRSAYRIQIDPIEQVKRIRLEASLWRPASITVESVAAQALFTRYMLPDPEHRLPIFESTTRFPKELRFFNMARLFESSKIRIRGQLTEGEIEPADSVAGFVEEWTGFKATGKRDDILDAVEKAIEGARLISGDPVFVTAHPGNASQEHTVRPALARGRLLRGTRPYSAERGFREGLRDRQRGRLRR